ncbi:single-stranded DNA-binding protein, partial [Enterococcus faecalis]
SEQRRANASTPVTNGQQANNQQQTPLPDPLDPFSKESSPVNISDDDLPF